MSLACSDPSDSTSVLFAAPVLVKTLCYRLLSKMHAALGNDANVRHFTRCAAQCQRSVGVSCAGSSEGNVRGEKIDQETDGCGSFDFTESRAMKPIAEFESLVSLCNDPNLSVCGLDEICVLAVVNYVMFLVEEIGKYN